MKKVELEPNSLKVFAIRTGILFVILSLIAIVALLLEKYSMLGSFNEIMNSHWSWIIVGTVCGGLATILFTLIYKE